MLFTGAIFGAAFSATHTLDSDASVSSPSTPAANELVLVDTRVPDYQTILDSLQEQAEEGRNLEIVLLASTGDGIQQISGVLARRRQLKAMHIISHGSDGAIELGSTTLDAISLTQNAATISRWDNSFTAGGDLLIYGCNVAKTQTGRKFLNRLSQMAGADVAASENLTGNAARGGDWTLEYATGRIDARIVIEEKTQQNWLGLLAIETFYADQDTYIMLKQMGNNFGASTNLIIDRENTDLQRALLRFDLSCIPANATINNATLRMQSTQIGGSLNISVYEMLQSWVEGTGNGTAGTANWNQRAPGTNWTTAGGTFNSTAVANLNTGSTGQHTWNITSLVQAWVAGSKVNNGLMVASPDGGGNRTVTYDSREGTTPPVLVIDYVSSILGNVFEDVNYGGGAGRSKAASSGVGMANAGVDLYNNAGSFVTFTNTNVCGNYLFAGLAPGAYTVRVVTSSVTSSRAGYTTSCKPVMTYRTNASSGTAVGVTDYVGGHDPATADAGNAGSGWILNAATGVFSGSGSGKAHAFAPVTVSAANLSGVDFGFNFDTIVNTNDSGQGSLRQFITNANTLGGDASLAQSGLVAGKENAVFMISNGTSAAGLRSANNYFSGGVATISPNSALPAISTVMVIDAQKQPGWTSAPILELNGQNAGSGAKGIQLTGGSSTVRGFVINRFTGSSTSAGIWIDTSGSNTIQGNYLGTIADGSAAAANYQGIFIGATTGNLIGGSAVSERNVVSGNTWRGIWLNPGSSSNTIRGNYVGLNAAGTAAVANNIGLYLYQSANNTIGGTGVGEGNVLSGNTSFGLYLVYPEAAGNIIQGNSIGLNAALAGPVPNGSSGVEFCCGSGGGATNNTIGGTAAGAANVIAGNTGRGIRIWSGTGNRILANSIYGNGNIGIDLGDDGVTANDGAKTAGQPNLLMDHPVFTSVALNSDTLTVAGYVGSASNQSTFAGVRGEIFESDNDSSGYGEGQTYIGYVTTDANGNFSGSLQVPSGNFTQITGTATDTGNNTSEFGPNHGFIVTAVDLQSFTAKGREGSVYVEWTTAQVDNFGFHVYRSESVGGPYTRITDRLIPGMTFSVRGRDYSYVDRNVTRGRLYYYKLEDIDFNGNRTMHGPVCVDWDGDGIPDDWEQRYGLNPAVDDSGLDPDGDGLTNLQEYYRGTDPYRMDADGDGVRDSQEEYVGRVTHGLMRGVEVIASDATGMTLELRTESFESVVLDEGGVSYRRLKVPEYVHGYTEMVGKPELPVKGILLDLPSGKGGTLSIESVESKELSNYWIYPVPDKVVSGEGELATVSEVFTIDEAAYRVNSFYPDVVARAGETYDYRGQKKLQVFFNPFSFNPVTKDLIQYTRIRVRVAYVALAEELPVVRSGVPLSAPVSSLARSVVWVPPAPAAAYKMLVSEEGIYRVTSAWLTSQGVIVSDWSQVRVYNLGQETPIYQGADYIEFYGVPPAEGYNKYTKHNVYWLTTSGGSGTPLRMTTIDGTPGTGTVSSTHEFTLHDERDESYIMDAPGEDSLDRWCFSTFVLGEAFPAADGGGLPQDFTVTLPGVTGIGSLRISMLGYYDTAHEVEVSVNGAVVGTYTWDGLTFLEAAADGVTLQSGDNTVTLRCKSGTDPMDPDVIVVDWIELSYPRGYVATNNLLKFSHDAGYRYQITGFTGADVEAFDITSATDVKRVLHLVRAGDKVDMEPQGTSGKRTYMALSSSAVKEPVGLTQDRASSLSSASNGADYILITHRDLGWDVGGDPYPWVSRLTALRQAQGLRVKLLDVEDIYDEFRYGIASAQGIKEFLSYAYSNWVQPKPQYVLIVGDAMIQRTTRVWTRAGTGMFPPILPLRSTWERR